MAGARVLAKDIVAATAKAGRTPVRSIMSRDRTLPLAHWRQRAIYLCREYRPDLSFPRLGMIFDRDHTTCLFAVKRVELRMGKGEAEGAALEAVRRQIAAEAAR